MARFSSILIFGCGNMAGAMLEGWLAGGVPASTFTVYNRTPKPVPEGVEQVNAVPQGRVFDAVMIGVKPQVLGSVVDQIEPLAGPETTVFSILAGNELASLAAQFPRAGAILRIMPNLACALGKSPIALGAQGLGAADLEAVTTLMAPLGTPEWMESEDQFHAVTALAGSGPAYVYRFIDALATGAAELGIEPAKAQRLATAMVEGAAALASASPLSAGQLADKVASPGGTTRAGMNVLDADGAINALMLATLTAARNRSEEMAQEARSKG
ncbi:NAD(P)-binding domain-containing protein [Novosphingobium sp. 1949]|uniref:Pyrroline-5-carboxylate reductase n=1 Tax=Novosphingobium organovorum TaxID=2930092 RepID=A0ABT0BFS8_9SPHN|nr:pyrroline-5-carboxylate reductase dimerization domain-containing protein [Novosphingobium organovorum]MCJ2183921.1 NAD(P)-binding domain-containing protein [Novosphingobium organovorum]